MSTIDEFFANKNVLVTGVSGFVGKVVLEKLIRSCPSLKTIFVLMRRKRDVEPKERLHKLFDETIFTKVRADFPGQLEKIRLVSGDLLNQSIIDDENDQKILMEEVNVIIHSAASVKFTEPLEVSLEINLVASYKLLELARKCRNLVSYVQVSTAYSNCYKKTLNEEVYDSQVNPLLIIKRDEETMKKLPVELQRFPNTYTYTKYLTESLVKRYADSFPIAIVRPSIICGAAFEPSPGWVDNFNGATGVASLLGSRTVGIFFAKTDNVVDIIPVDFVAYTAIAAAARAPQAGFKVYNCTTSVQNPCTQIKLLNEGFDYINSHIASGKSFYGKINTPIYTTSESYYETHFFWKYTLPARILDTLAKSLGKKPVSYKVYSRVKQQAQVMNFFTTTEFRFDNTNTQQLFEQLQDKDKKEFNFDVGSLDWPSYMRNYSKGMLAHVLENAGTLQNLKRVVDLVKNTRRALNIVVILVILKVVSMIYQSYFL